MPRLRVLIKHHTGVSQKPGLWELLYQRKVTVYKVIETREAFILIADAENLEKLLMAKENERFIA